MKNKVSFILFVLAFFSLSCCKNTHMIKYSKEACSSDEPKQVNPIPIEKMSFLKCVLNAKDFDKIYNPENGIYNVILNDSVFIKIVCNSSPRDSLFSGELFFFEKEKLFSHEKYYKCDLIYQTKHYRNRKFKLSYFEVKGTDF